MRVQSVWPGGMVKLPELRLESDPLVVFAGPRRRGGRRKVHRLEACATEAEGLRAVILGLAREGRERETE